MIRKVRQAVSSPSRGGHPLRGRETLCKPSTRACGIIKGNLSMANDGLTEDGVGFVNNLILNIDNVNILAAASSTQGAK